MVIQTSDLMSFLNSDLVSGLANVSQFYDFLHTQLEKMHNERLAAGESAESVYKDSYNIFEQMYHQWEEKVAYEVNTFVFKK